MLVIEQDIINSFVGLCWNEDIIEMEWLKLYKEFDVLNAEILSDVLGKAYSNKYQKHTALLTDKIQIKDISKTALDKEIALFVHNGNYLSNWIHNFCFTSWLVKDCAINSFDTIAIRFINKQESGLFTNRKGNLFSNSQGKYDPVEFSKKDVYEVESIMKKIEMISENRESIHISDKFTGMMQITFNAEPVNSNYMDYSKFEKAIKFVYDARTTSFLLSKIFLMVSALKSMFVTSKDQVTKQVITRVPKFLNHFGKKELASRTRLNAIYDTRSSYVHSGSYSKRLNKIEEHSLYLDSVVRGLLMLLVDNDDARSIIELEDRYLDSWFENLK